MTAHNRPNPRNGLEGLQDQIKKLTDSHDRMKNETTKTVQINNIADDEVQDPVEGEIRIDYSDNQIAWRVNDAWHKPAGANVVWAAVYDDFIMGEDMTGILSGRRLHFLDYDISDSAGGHIQITDEGTFAEWGVNTYVPRILTPGVYAIQLHIDWSDPNFPHTLVRYYLEGFSGTFPGELSGVFGGLWSEFLHVSVGFNDWNAADSVIWVLPIRPNFGGTDIAPGAVLMDYSLAFETGATGFDMVMGFKRLWVMRLGDLDLATGTFGGNGEIYN